MNKNTKQDRKDQIETIETVKLDAVTGGCAACGSANCKLKDQRQAQ